MRVVIAHTSGFCNGVKRAMRMAVDAANLHNGLQADGPLVHNRQAIELLSLHGIGDPDTNPGKPMLVRAHGVAPEQRRRWQQQGLTLVDATCVHVAVNQKRAADAAAKGRIVLLAGDADHAEVRAVASSAGPACRILSSSADVPALDGVPEDAPVFLLAQTTFNVAEFARIADAVRRRFQHATVADTICRATHDRQEEAARLSESVDVMVVVGGRHSANTQRLADTATAAGKPVFLVETADELRAHDFDRYQVAGVTAGASTPGWITQEVVNRLRGFGKPRWQGALMRMFLHLAQIRLTTAASAAGLALAAQYYSLEQLLPATALAGAGYVFFSHTLNRRVPPHPAMRRLSQVEAFYQEQRGKLLPLAWLSAAAALVLAASRGMAVFLMFFIAVAATIAYRLYRQRTESAPAAGQPRHAPRNWTMALGWAFALGVPPLAEGASAADSMGAGLFILLICLGGTLLRDLHDIASDRLLGIDTLATGLGTPRAQKLVSLAFAIAVGLPFAACFSVLGRSGVSGVWYAFTLTCAAAPALGLHLLESLRHGRLRDAVLLQCAVDAMGVMAGVAALAAAFAAGVLS